MSRNHHSGPLEHRKSLPWIASEYLYVDGIGCTYSIGHDGVIVHLPGRVDVPLIILRNKGLDIQEPRKWRVTSYA